jgi:transcription elongation factor GreA
MLKKTIMEAKIIDTTLMDTSTVQILATVELRNVKTKQQMKYTIVSATEADLRAGKLSVETPIAKGLLGKKVGEIAEVKVPAGTIQLEIVNIKFE